MKDFQHSASHEIACTSIYIPIDELTFEQIFSSCLTLQTPHLGFKVHLRCNLTLGLGLDTRKRDKLLGIYILIDELTFEQIF